MLMLIFPTFHSHYCSLIVFSFASLSIGKENDFGTSKKKKKKEAEFKNCISLFFNTPHKLCFRFDRTAKILHHLPLVTLLPLVL